MSSMKAAFNSSEKKQLIYGKGPSRVMVLAERTLLAGGWDHLLGVDRLRRRLLEGRVNGLLEDCDEREVAVGSGLQTMGGVRRETGGGIQITSDQTPTG